VLFAKFGSIPKKLIKTAALRLGFIASEPTAYIRVLKGEKLSLGLLKVCPIYKIYAVGIKRKIQISLVIFMRSNYYLF
jgi:hypothetical protein